VEFNFTEEQQQLRKSVREFAEGEIAPHVMEWDEASHFPVEIIPKLGEMGLLGVIFPEVYGGAGLGYIEYALAIEELARVDGSVGLIDVRRGIDGDGPLTLLTPGVPITAEKVALDNLKKGMPAGKAAEKDNPFCEWIGADIRADPWGYLAPGWPERRRPKRAPCRRTPTTRGAL
jgi:hypothetical protein